MAYSAYWLYFRIFLSFRKVVFGIFLTNMLSFKMIIEGALPDIPGSALLPIILSLLSVFLLLPLLPSLLSRLLFVYPLPVSVRWYQSV
jgi:hypothetical protein